MIPMHRSSSVAIPSLQIVMKYFIRLPLTFEDCYLDSEPRI